MANTTATSLLLSETTFAIPVNATARPYAVNAINTTLTTPSIVVNASSITQAPLCPTALSYPDATNNTSNATRNTCQAEYDAYESGWWDWYPTTQITFTTASSILLEITTYSTELYECTQTCGTICYANNVTTVVSTSISTMVLDGTYVDNPPFPTPLPNCTIPFDECLDLQTSYSSAVTSYSSMDLGCQAYQMEPVRPYCSACVSTTCSFNGMFGMNLYYWPATTSVSRDYCASEPAGGWASTHVPDVNNTYVPITTGTYAVVDGITMYQGNVYIAFDQPQVQDNCNARVPRKDPDGKNVITIASDALHSIRKYPDYLATFPIKWDLTPWPVNYDDFNPPTPWSAYSGMWECVKRGQGNADPCSIVRPDSYHPYMMMPPQIRDLDPNWANCKFDEYASFDPPIALHPADMFSSSPTPTPVTEVKPEKTPATPGQSGGGGIPVATPGPGQPQSPGSEHTSDHSPGAQPSQGPSDNKPKPSQDPRPTAPTAVSQSVITIGPTAIPIDSSGGLIIESGVTLRPGDPATAIDGTTVSVGSSGAVIVDSKGTSTIAISAGNSPPRAITVGSSVLPVDTSGGLVIKPGTTLRAGDPPVTISGTTLSLGPSGLVMMDAGMTSTVPLPVAQNPRAVITMGSSLIPMDSAGGLIIGPGRTLHLSDPPIVIDGMTYSIGVSGLVVISARGTSTIAIPTESQLITVGSNTYTLANGQLVMGDKLTLSGPGGMAIIAGTTVLLKSESVVVMSQGSTSTIPIKSKLHGTRTNSAGVEETGSPDVKGATSPKKKSAAAAIGIMDHLRCVIVSTLVLLLAEYV